MTTHRKELRNELRSESGSAYLLAIMVILILTMVGLAVSLTTQSEMRIGENERLQRRSFYSADAGINIQTAKALVAGDQNCFNLDLVEESQDPNLHIRNRIQTSHFAPVSTGWCNLCQVNQDSPFQKVNHVVTSVATRVAWEGDPDNPPQKPAPMAEERLTVMVSLQPFNADTQTAVNAITPGTGSGFDWQTSWEVSGSSANNLCGILEGF